MPLLTTDDRRKLGLAVAAFNRRRPGRHVRQVTVMGAAVLLWRRTIDRLTSDDIEKILSARVALAENGRPKV